METVMQILELVGIAVIAAMVYALVVAILAIRRTTQGQKATSKPETKRGRWEAAGDEDGQFWHVRWSEPDAEGRYMYVRHYPEKWRAESNARTFNEANRFPWEWPDWKSATASPRGNDI